MGGTTLGQIVYYVQLDEQLLHFMEFNESLLKLGAREIWQASMTHIATEGGYFGLFAYQFCRRENCMFSPERISGGSNGDISIDTILCSAGSVTVSPSGQDHSADLGKNLYLHDC